MYLSSNAHPPFLSRYLTTKHEAEDLLFSSKNEGYSLRPGFIHNSQHRVWSVPLNYGIKAWNKAYPYVHGIVSIDKLRHRLRRSCKRPLSNSSKAIPPRSRNSEIPLSRSALTAIQRRSCRWRTSTRRARSTSKQSRLDFKSIIMQVLIN